MLNNNIIQAIQSMQRMGNNPQAIVEHLMKQNPQIQALVNQVRNSGMTPSQYLEQYAKQNNMTEQVAQIKNMLGFNK